MSDPRKKLGQCPCGKDIFEGDRHWRTDLREDDRYICGTCPARVGFKLIEEETELDRVKRYLDRLLQYIAQQGDGYIRIPASVFRCGREGLSLSYDYYPEHDVIEGELRESGTDEQINLMPLEEAAMGNATEIKTVRFCPACECWVDEEELLSKEVIETRRMTDGSRIPTGVRHVYHMGCEVLSHTIEDKGQ